MTLICPQWILNIPEEQGSGRAYQIIDRHGCTRFSGDGRITVNQWNEVIRNHDLDYHQFTCDDHGVHPLPEDGNPDRQAQTMLLNAGWHTCPECEEDEEPILFPNDESLANHHATHHTFAPTPEPEPIIITTRDDWQTAPWHLDPPGPDWATEHITRRMRENRSDEYNSQRYETIPLGWAYISQATNRTHVRRENRRITDGLTAGYVEHRIVYGPAVPTSHGVWQS